MSESSLQIVERLSEGLNTVDLSHVTKLVEMFGLYGAARIMGYDVSHYNNLLMAGRLAIENLKINSPKTLLEYAHMMKSRLNKMTYNFIVENHVELQAAIDRNAHRDYDHDWFSANTMITMYSANPAYGKEGIEIPQYTWMRIAIQLYHDSSNALEDVIRAYEELSVGWYTPASPTIFNAGMRDPQMASCFVEGTEVCTLSGVKRIESVAIGDTVITHTGAAKKVLQIHTNKLGDRTLYDLKCWKTPNIRVTGNHRVLAIKRNKQLDWIPVDQLTTEHYIAIPRKKLQITDPEVLTIDLAQYLQQIQRGDHVTYEYEVTEDMIYTTSASRNVNATGECTTRHKHAPIKRYLRITHDVATAIGMWYGDGCIRNRKDRKVGEQHICGLNIVAEENNERLITFWVEVMKNLTGIQASISRQANLIYGEIHSPILGEIFNILFGKGFSGKRLHPSMYRWAASHVRSFMIGLMSTDGCVTTAGDMVITLTNRTLVKQLYHMCRQIGEDVSYNEDNKLRNGATDISATIKLSKGWIQPCELYKYYDDDRLNIRTSRINTNGAYRDMGMVFTKVKSITESSLEKPEYVYTLGIEDDHSYNVEGLIVENCFLLTIGDDLESILKTGIFRGGMISKSSGGLGFDVSRVRHSEIRETGWSNGIIPMLQLYNYMVRYVDQGGRRKGAATIFLRPHHIDVEDFIELPRKVGDKYARAHDLNICLWTSWIFWERVRTNGKWTLFCPARVPQLNDVYGVEFTKAYLAAEEDTTIASRHKKVINARDLYNKILDIQRETGMPYLMNGDSANIKSNHRHLGYIRSSNLCVAGETPILTKNGYFPIQSLQDQDVEVWNGNEWSKVTVKQTAPRRHLITVYFSNGRSLTCTPDHKFIIGDGPLKEARRVPTQLLVPGVKLRQENLPVVDGSVPFAHPYLHGALCAFGCFTDKGPLLDIMGQAMNSILNHSDIITTESGAKAFPDNLPAPYTVPINSSISVKVQWLSGFLTARSFVTKLGVTLININDTLLQDIQLLLTTLGVRSFFEQNAPTKVPLPENKNIMISNCGLMIPWNEFAKLQTLGLTTSHVIPENYSNEFNDLLVTEIIDIGRLSPTYCFTEEKNNAGIFNGILTGQCLEVIEFTDDETIAVCNLHSLSLRMFGKTPLNHGNRDLNDALRQAVDFSQLSYMSRRVVENLNRVIDHNWYPLDKIKDGKIKPKIINRSNKRHRPVGMGVSGFAELLHILDLPFEDPAVNVLNKMVFACMYWNALAQSVQLAIKEGSYESFHGSPTSQGKLQFDLWKEEFKIVGPNSVRKEEDDEPIEPLVWGQVPIDLYSADGQSIIDVIRPTWSDLKRCIMKYGLRNSLLIALMPTASTAQVRRNCESVEAHQNNMYSRKVLKCSYPVLNRYLVSDLEALGAWNDSTVEYIRVKNGSILGLTDYITSNSHLFPNFSGNVDRLSFLEKKYKTMWEIPQKTFMKLAAERGRYIDQSASTNVYIRDCTDEKLRACHLYANMLGLKTLMYYLRQTGGETIKFTADPSMIQHIKGVVVEAAKEEKKEDDSSKSDPVTIDLTGTFASLTATPGSGDASTKKKKYICDDHSCCT